MVKNLLALTCSIIFAVTLPTVANAQGLGALSGGTVSNQEAVNYLDSLTPPLASEGARKAADIMSWATVITAMALDANATIGKCDGQDECYRAVVLTGVRLGATWGATFALKKLVERTRPCAPDCGYDNPNYSFPSGHTAFAFSTVGGPRLEFALPLAIGTGGLRVAAGKHWLTDTLAGAGIGLLTSRIR